MIVPNVGSLHRCAIAVVSVAIGMGTLLTLGCGGSGEVQKDRNTIDSLRVSIDALSAENSNYKSQVSRLEQENKNLVAQRPYLETKLAEAKSPPPPTKISNPQAEYDHGLSLARGKNYQEAMSVFMGLLNGGAPENLESNCHYWIGECYYGMKQYKDALTHFETVLGYSRSTKKDDAQFMMANCYNRMRDKERAKQEYQKLIDQYPASEYVQRAKDELAKIK